MNRAAAGLCAALLVVLYLVVSLRHLDTAPPVHEDEPWQASTGSKLATEGVFGSDLMAGFSGMERRYYAFMPVHPLLLAAVFRVGGVGLVQARLEAVLLGLAVLVLTGVLAARLFDRTVAVVAMAVLVTVPWLPMPPFRLTGIPLLDQARIARYDLGVPVFGLAALLVFLSAGDRRSAGLFAASGALVGAAGLCHLYGFFWLPVLLILAVWNREPRRHLAALVAGLAVTLLPYALYVLSDLQTWSAQTRQYAPRFHLLDPGWYLANLRAEPLRYGFTTASRLLRPGPLLFLSGLPVAVAALLRRVRGDRDRAARTVVVPALVLPAMLTLLIAVKQPGYLLTVVPVGAVALGWGTVALWRQAQWPLRMAILAVGLAAAAHGASGIAALERKARVTTPYPELAGRLRAEIPDGSRVLALHRFWFGLEDLEVRSWWVPIALADPSCARPVVDLADSLEAIAPDVILLDDQVRSTLAERPALGRAFHDHLRRHGLRYAAGVDDPTYGRIEVYRRPPKSSPRPSS